MGYSNWWKEGTVSVIIDPPTSDDQGEYPDELVIEMFHDDRIETIGECVSAAFSRASDTEYVDCGIRDGNPKILFKSKQYFVGLLFWVTDYVVVFGVNPELENSYYAEDKRTLALARANYELMAEKFFDRLQGFYPLLVRTSAYTRGKRELSNPLK